MILSSQQRSRYRTKGVDHSLSKSVQCLIRPPSLVIPGLMQIVSYERRLFQLPSDLPRLATKSSKLKLSQSLRRFHRCLSSSRLPPHYQSHVRPRSVHKNIYLEKAKIITFSEITNSDNEM